MSKTLLDGVNEVGKRCGWLDSFNTNLLTSLTQSNVQRDIDLTIQLINEGLDELARGNQQLYNQVSSSTITLVTGQREYSLPSDLITMIWPMRDTTNAQYINEWGGSYEDILLYDPNQSFTGLPLYGIISPITGKLRTELACDTADNGRVYNFEYKKNLALVLATDPMPFNDEAFRAMVPAWSQLWRRERNKEFDKDLYFDGIGRASYAVTQSPMRDSYSPRGAPVSDMTPVIGV